MADTFIQLPADGTGRKLAASDWVQGADTVHGQKLILVDTAGNVVAVADSSLQVSQRRVGTATLANVASSATNVTIRAANTNRRGLIVHNDSTQILYLKYGATASATSYTYKIPPDYHWEMPEPVYTGVLDGIWAAANGNARVTELTA